MSSAVKGIFYGDGGQLVAQIIGCITLIIWAFGLSYVFFKVLDLFVKLRVPTDVELEAELHGKSNTSHIGVVVLI